MQKIKCHNVSPVIYGLIMIPLKLNNVLYFFSTARLYQYLNYSDVASDVGVNFKNVGVLSIESSLFHLFHKTFFQTKHQRKCY